MRFLILAVLMFASRLAFSQETPVTREQPVQESTDLPICGTPHAGENCVTAPHAVYAPDPDYTKEARKKHLQGSVLLNITVGADGVPYNLSVRRSLDSSLDQEAVKVVKTWKFKPGTLKGKPVAVRLLIEVFFHLL